MPGMLRTALPRPRVGVRGEFCRVSEIVWDGSGPGAPSQGRAVVRGIEDDDEDEDEHD